jgi:alkanesulfonate monooxygenase SsuD/methylene tetrahydromethanopterin reductase-like flavin-dependent oxidoreductase (luciferase family)
MAIDYVTKIGAPFARGSVSLRLYPHNELDASGVVNELCAQARMGLDAGFDGIMTSEHHGGVGGYIPNPFQMASFVLEESAVGWTAACPLLLPLRPTALVAEETAWLAARHPGRVGLGVAAGAMALDFTSMGLALSDAVPSFKRELGSIVAMLQGRELRGLDEDRALQQCKVNPIPVLSAAVSLTAARRAAACGAGILLEGMSSVAKVAAMSKAFDDEGGTGSKVLVRRVWLGEPRREAVANQRRFYETNGPAANAFPEDQTVTSPDPAELAERLVAIQDESGVDAINLRVHLPGLSAQAIREQISALGTEVLPAMRRLASGPLAVDGAARDQGAVR